MRHLQDICGSFLSCSILIILQVNFVYTKDCSQAIGIGQGKIPDNDLSASSSYDDLSQGARGRLNIEYQPPQKSGWCAKVNDQNQYLQIDLEADSELTGVATQGRGREPYSHWVTKYYVSLREEKGPWFNFTKARQLQPVIFTGNSDSFSTVFHSFNRPIKARYVRFHPVEWNIQICMRAELYGCLGKKLVIEDDKLLVIFIILLAVVCVFFILLLILLLIMRRLLKLLERRANEKARAEISLRDSIDGDRRFKLDRSTGDTYMPEQPTQGTFTKSSKQSGATKKDGKDKPVYATIQKSKQKSKPIDDDGDGYAEPETKEKKAKKNSRHLNDPKIILVDADEEEEKRRSEERKSKNKMETIDL